MHLAIPVFTLLLATSTAVAQQIEFRAADPHPDFPGALMGDMDFADVDGDGDQDFFICGRNDGWTSSPASALYLNDGQGNFTVDVNNPFPDLQFSASVFADLDRDGDQDLLLSGRTDFSEKIANLYLNDGQGGLTLAQNTALDPCENGGYALGDVDGDGAVDIFQFGERGPLGTNQPFVKLLRNAGAGQFTVVATPLFDNFNTINLVDLEGDGDVDVVARLVVPNMPTRYTLFDNDGTGGFTQLSTPAFGDLDGTALAIGDVDGDNDADFFVSGMDTTGSPLTSLYLSEGAGQFSLFAGSSVFPGIFAGENAFHDLDSDGDLDILMSGSGPGGLSGFILTSVYENQGNNEFVLADSLTGSYISNNAAGDINGDGLLDLVVSGTTVGTPSFKTWVYLNQGQPVSNVQDRTAALDVELYPNPTTGALTLNANESTELSVELYSATGQRLWSQRLQGQGASSLFIKQPTGLYLLTVEANGKRSTKRVSVIR